MNRDEAWEIVADMTEEELILFRDAILEKLHNQSSDEDHLPEAPAAN